MDSITKLCGPDVTPEQVLRRVDDGLQRLHSLIGQIERWALGHGWTVEDKATVDMDEQLMRRFGVGARQQPALKLRRPNGAERWVMPNALWVAGANGRADLLTCHGVYALIDPADPFDPPRSVLHCLGNGERRAFQPQHLADLA